MLTLLAPFLGILGSLLPSLVKIFERKQELQHEIELIKVKLEAARVQGNIDIAVKSAEADVAEGKSLRDHDMSLDGGHYVNILRASIRPVVTYVFFILFVAVKVSAAYVMIKTGQSIPEMLKAVWDADTQALFSTIMGFWFGSRYFERFGGGKVIQTPVVISNKKK